MTPLLIAPRLLNLRTTPKSMDADGQLAGTPPVTCDAIVIVVTEAGVAALAGDAVARVHSDDGVVDLGSDFIAAAALRYHQRLTGVQP